MEAILNLEKIIFNIEVLTKSLVRTEIRCNHMQGMHSRTYFTVI